MNRPKTYTLLFLTMLLGVLSACNMATLGSPLLDNHLASSRAVTGPNGTIDVTGMIGTSMTVSYNSGSPITSAKLYVSEGNGTGLVLAAKEMTYSGGVYSYTLNHPTFTTGEFTLPFLKMLMELKPVFLRELWLILKVGQVSPMDQIMQAQTPVHPLL